MKQMTMILAAMAAASVWASAESDLEAKLPSIFKASAAHYEKLMAASELAQPKPRVDTNGVEQAGRPRFPRNFDGGVLGTVEDTDWTSGFFPGSLWYLYEATGDEAWKTAAVKWTDRLVGIKDYVDNHDIGFMLYCSAGNALRITGDAKYEAWLHSAAKCLRERFSEKTGTIRSWNNWAEPCGFFGMHFVTIIDNMMNLELLTWDSRWWDRIDGAWWSGQVARKHADTTLKHHFRADGSAYHVVDYDPETGKVHGIRAGQGACVEGTWARGQAWAVYGYTMMYRETAFARYLDQAVKAADYVMDAPTPSDGIPYWDYKAADIPNEPRDSSAAAILASSLLELSQYVAHEKAARYRAWAVKALNTLAGDGYFAKPGECADFLIKHGTGVKPFGSEVDTPLNYGDYYFLEALLRFRELRRIDSEIEPYAKKLPAKAGLPSDEMVRRHGCTNFVAAAEKILAEPIPDASDELYLEFWKTGNRDNYQTPRFQRFLNLARLAEAERIEGKGRFLKRIEEYLGVILAMKSWVLPAHDWTDGQRGNFNRTIYSVDLGSADAAEFLGEVVDRIGDRLAPETVRLVKEECERRVFAPIRRELPRRMFPGTRPETPPALDINNWWMDGCNNWNAVCWDYVVSAALALIDDPTDRARFVAAADRAVDVYIEQGFAADGYCSEGMGYWNYGYGHHLRMGSLLRRVSDGKIDVFNRPKQRLCSGYARAYTLREGASPAFADGNGAVAPVFQDMVDEYWPDLPKALPAMSEFQAGQVWLFRDPDGLSVGIKGGHNNELHNHNDVGSYYLMDGDKFVAGDPGGEVYTRRTFSPERYESQVLNSYGHPVPVIDGKLQPEGSNFCARVVEKKVKVRGEGEQWNVDSLKLAKGDEVYEIVLDMTAAYDVKTLKKLTRTFVYDRKAKTFTVTDRVSFSEPTAFEDCYVTHGDKPNVEVKALKGGKVSMKETIIDNPGKPTPHRFGYAFEQPVVEAEVAFVFRSGEPVAASAAKATSSVPVAKPVTSFLPEPVFRPAQIRNGEQPVAVDAKREIVAENGLYRRVETTITFTNPNHRVFEGELEFPLPDGATVCGYALDVNGTMVPGVICPKEQARVAFENEKRKGIDPGIVEHVKGNLWKTRIYPLMPNTPRKAMVAYLEPLDGEEATVAEKDPESGEIFVAVRGKAEKTVSIAEKLRAAKKAAIIWDASYSRLGKVATDRARLELLPENGEWTLIVFRNVAEAAKTFTARAELLKAIDAVKYDGGTAFAALPTDLGGAPAFLFSDETDTLSPKAPDLEKLGFVFASRPDGEKRKIVVRKAKDGENVGNVGSGQLLATAWAANRIADLASQADARKDEFLELGRKYGVASPVTSLIVLERLDQYLEYRIEPPKTLAFHDEWVKRRAAADDAIADEKTAADHRAKLLSYWEERVKWWNDPIPPKRTPKSGVFDEAVAVSEAPMTTGAGNSSERSASSRAMMPLSMAVADNGGSMARSGRHSAMAAAMDYLEDSEEVAPRAAASARERSAAANSAAPSVPQPTAATIKLAAWNPKMPYLKAISDAAYGYAYDTYLEQREVHGGAPAFYLDCAGWFFRAKEPALGCRIISTLAELKLEDVGMWRTMGWRLREAGEYDAAVNVFRHVFEMRPEESQSRRDLALVLAERGKANFSAADLTEAARLYKETAFTPTARRSGRRGNDMQSAVFALEELNGLLAWCKANAGKVKGFVAPELDSAFRRDLPVALRITLAWDTDETDIDLHVLEPNGEEAYYGHRRTSKGGFVSEDVTTGYGPEEYLAKDAQKGVYRIKTNYYASRRQQLTGAATVTATVYTDWGEPSEKREIFSLRLDKQQDRHSIGEVTVE